MRATLTGMPFPNPAMGRKLVRGKLTRLQSRASYKEMVATEIIVRQRGLKRTVLEALLPTLLKSSTKLHFSAHTSSQIIWKNIRMGNSFLKRRKQLPINGTTRAIVCRKSAIRKPTSKLKRNFSDCKSQHFQKYTSTTSRRRGKRHPESTLLLRRCSISAHSWT